MCGLCTDPYCNDEINCDYSNNRTIKFLKTCFTIQFKQNDQLTKSTIINSIRECEEIYGVIIKKININQNTINFSYSGVYCPKFYFALCEDLNLQNIDCTITEKLFTTQNSLIKAGKKFMDIFISDYENKNLSLQQAEELVAHAIKSKIKIDCYGLEQKRKNPMDRLVAFQEAYEDSIFFVLNP